MYGCPPVHAPEYGCPWVEYTVDITVSDKESKTPIKDIKVSLMGIFEEGDHAVLATSQTDAEGKASVIGGSYSECDRYFVTVEDIDGEENGGQYDSKVVPFTHPNESHQHLRAELSKQEE
jgi:putative lipoprotein (rSAM/lipoprotein system)